MYSIYIFIDSFIYYLYYLYIIYHWIRTIIFDYLLSVCRNLFITNLNFIYYLKLFKNFI